MKGLKFQIFLLLFLSCDRVLTDCIEDLEDFFQGCMIIEYPEPSKEPSEICKKHNGIFYNINLADYSDLGYDLNSRLFDFDVANKKLQISDDVCYNLFMNESYNCKEDTIDRFFFCKISEPESESTKFCSDGWISYEDLCLRSVIPTSKFDNPITSCVKHDATHLMPGTGFIEKINKFEDASNGKMVKQSVNICYDFGRKNYAPCPFYYQDMFFICEKPANIPVSKTDEELIEANSPVNKTDEELIEANSPVNKTDEELIEANSTVSKPDEELIEGCLDKWFQFSSKCYRIFRGNALKANGLCEKVKAENFEIKNWLFPKLKESMKNQSIEEISLDDSRCLQQTSTLDEDCYNIKMYYVCKMNGTQCDDGEYDDDTNTCKERGNCPPNFKLDGEKCIESEDINDEDCMLSGGIKINIKCTIDSNQLCPRGSVRDQRSCYIFMKKDHRTCYQYGGKLVKTRDIKLFGRDAKELTTFSSACVLKDVYCDLSYKPYIIDGKDISDTCIKYFTISKKNSEAIAHCKKDRSRLFEPKSQKSMKHARKNVFKNNEFWVGFSIMQTNGSIIDISNNEQTLSQKFWKKDSPHAIQIAYCSIIYEGDSAIRHTGCNRNLYFMCEKNDICREPYTVKFKDTCLSRPTKQNYFDAVKHCGEIGGFIAEKNSISSDSGIVNQWISGHIDNGNCKALSSENMIKSNCLEKKKFFCQKFDGDVKNTYRIGKYTLYVDKRQQEFNDAVISCFNGNGRLFDDEETQIPDYLHNFLQQLQIQSFWFGNLNLLYNECSYYGKSENQTKYRRIIGEKCDNNHSAVCIYRDAACPTRFIYFNGRCIRFDMIPKSYDEAIGFCESIKSNFVTIPREYSNYKRFLLHLKQNKKIWVHAKDYKTTKMYSGTKGCLTLTGVNKFKHFNCIFAQEFMCEVVSNKDDNFKNEIKSGSLEAVTLEKEMSFINANNYCLERYNGILQQQLTSQIKSFICKINQNNCPTSYKYFESRCYKVPSSSFFDYDTAEKKCIHNNNQIAIAYTEDHLRFFEQLANYKIWVVHKNENGSNRCTYVNAGSVKTDCNDKALVVCQKGLPICEETWHNSNGICYKMYKGYVNVEKAKNNCKEKNAVLGGYNLNLVHLLKDEYVDEVLIGGPEVSIRNYNGGISKANLTKIYFHYICESHGMSCASSYKYIKEIGRCVRYYEANTELKSAVIQCKKSQARLISISDLEFFKSNFDLKINSSVWIGAYIRYESHGCLFYSNGSYICNQPKWPKKDRQIHISVKNEEIQLESNEIDKAGFICEYIGICPPGFKYDQEFCFKVQNSQLLANARHECHLSGGRLFNVFDLNSNFKDYSNLNKDYEALDASVWAGHYFDKVQRKGDSSVVLNARNDDKARCKNIVKSTGLLQPKSCDRRFKSVCRIEIHNRCPLGFYPFGTSCMKYFENSNPEICLQYGAELFQNVYLMKILFGNPDTPGVFCARTNALCYFGWDLSSTVYPAPQLASICVKRTSDNLNREEAVKKCEKWEAELYTPTSENVKELNGHLVSTNRIHIGMQVNGISPYYTNGKPIELSNMLWSEDFSFRKAESSTHPLQVFLKNKMIRYKSYGKDWRRTAMCQKKVLCTKPFVYNVDEDCYSLDFEATSEDEAFLKCYALGGLALPTIKHNSTDVSAFKTRPTNSNAKSTFCCKKPISGRKNTILADDVEYVVNDQEMTFFEALHFCYESSGIIINSDMQRVSDNLIKNLNLINITKFWSGSVTKNQTEFNSIELSNGTFEVILNLNNSTNQVVCKVGDSHCPITFFNIKGECYNFFSTPLEYTEAAYLCSSVRSDINSFEYRNLMHDHCDRIGFDCDYWLVPPYGKHRNMFLQDKTIKELYLYPSSTNEFFACKENKKHLEYCGQDSFYYNNNCYYVQDTQNYTCQEAFQECRARNLSLATFENYDEIKFANKLISSTSKLWFGMYLGANFESFSMNETEQSFLKIPHFLHFMETNSFHENLRSCITVNSNGKYNFENCSSLNSFFCMKLNCPIFNLQCYEFETESMKYDDAMNHCNSQNKILPQLMNPYLNYAGLFSLISDTDSTVLNVWTQMFYQNNEFVIPESSTVITSAFTFPIEFPGNESCAYLSNERWNFKNVEEKLGFFCQSKNFFLIFKKF